MVRHRWTLALIVIGIPVFVTVSAFRVRLAHERTDSQKPCDSCDVNELNLDQKQSKLSSKRVHDGLKKVVLDKLVTVPDGKLSADDLTYLHELSDNKKFKLKVKPKGKEDIKNDIDKELDDNEKKINKKQSESVKFVNARSKLKNHEAKKDIGDENNNDDDLNADEDTRKVHVTGENDRDDVYISVEDNDGSDSVVDVDADYDNDADNDNNTDNDNDKIDEIDNTDDGDDDKYGKIKEVPKPAIKLEINISEKVTPFKSLKREEIISKVIKKEERKVDPKMIISEPKLKETVKSISKKTTTIEITKEAKKEMEMTSNDTKLRNDLEKIKVKSHIEAGKLQSQVISKDKQSKNEKEIKVENKIKKESESLGQFSKGTVKAKTKNDKIKSFIDSSHRKTLLQSEFEHFYDFFPTFAPNFSRVHNPECRRHGQILLRQLRGTKLWALNLLDATAKIPSGLLQGNGIQLGDFDQCLGSRARVQLETGSIVKVQGKYCLVTMDVKAEHPELEVPVDLLQGRNVIKGRISDPGHFVPRFSTLSWGVCVPSPCNPDDVEIFIKDATKHYQKLGISVNVEVDELDCHVLKKGNWWEDWMEIPTLLTLCFYGVVLCLVIIATCQDLLGEKTDQESDTNEGRKLEDHADGSQKRSDGFLSTFSLSRTVKKLVAPVGADEIPSIHGLRATATLALIAAHKFLPVAHMPYTNRVKLAEIVSSPIWSWCRVGWVFTDCFLLLSGALTAYRTSDKTSAFNKLASKYLRLTPALLAVIWFYAYVWDHISMGPMWGGLVTKNADVCRDGWWWNMFYLQNYFGLENMCAPQTHQLALDMQLSFVGSLIVWAIQSDIVGSRLAMPLIHMFAAYSRYTTFRDHRLTMIAYHGVSVSQLYRTGRMSYTSILHRSTSYLIGISLGLALRAPAKHNKLLIFVGWVVSTGLLGAVLWSGFDSGFLNYQYNVTFAAQYAALAPIATALAFAWLLYAAHNGYSETLSSLLCSRLLLLISRLSYALYLTQFIVFLTNAATVKTSTEFTLLSVIDIQEISAIFLSATVLTLTLVIPMQSLPNIFFGKKKNIDKIEKEESMNNIEEFQSPKDETPAVRKPLLAHREFLEETPEQEVEYETQRDRQSLEEILEEEDDNLEEERIEDEDLEIIEEEGGEEDLWAEREVNPEGHDRDLEEWEWANGNRDGAQHYRYSR